MAYTLIASGTSAIGKQLLYSPSANFTPTALFIECDTNALGLSDLYIGTITLLAPANGFGSTHTNFLSTNWEHIFGQGLVFRPVKYNVPPTTVLAGSDLVAHWKYGGIPWRVYWL